MLRSFPPNRTQVRGGVRSASVAHDRGRPPAARDAASQRVCQLGSQGARGCAGLHHGGGEVREGARPEHPAAPGPRHDAPDGGTVVRQDVEEPRGFAAREPRESKT